jgi:hypothetical protein
MATSWVDFPSSSGKSNPWLQYGSEKAYKQAQVKRADGSMPQVSDWYNTLGVTGANNLGAFNGGQQMGLANLLQNLGNQGRIDPRQFNRQLVDIQRGTQVGGDAIRGEAARNGLQNSGLAQALLAANNQGGENRRAGAIAQNEAQAADRNRADIDQMLATLIQPGIDYAAIGAGQYQARQQSDQQKQAAKQAQIGQLVGMFATLMGCWVAAELYGGWWEPRTMLARIYMNFMAPADLREAYMRDGEALAEAVKHNPDLRASLLPVFDGFAQDALAALRG